MVKSEEWECISYVFVDNILYVCRCRFIVASKKIPCCAEIIFLQQKIKFPAARKQNSCSKENRKFIGHTGKSHCADSLHAAKKRKNGGEKTCTLRKKVLILYLLIRQQQKTFKTNQKVQK